MILAVDIGNTNIVVGFLDKTNIIAQGRIGTDRGKTEIDFLIQFKLMMQVYSINQDLIEGSILSSVVPEITKEVAKSLEFLLKKKPLIIGHGIKTGLNIKIDNQKTLGADRVCDAVCVIEEYKTPAIIVDMGTATTLSVVDNDNNHIGGMIIPGIKTSLDSLSMHASQLPFISLEAPKNLIGKNTVECMQSGLIYGSASMIDGLIDRVKKELGDEVSVIVTGGLGKLVVPYMTTNVTYDPNLLLKGLYYIYKKNN